MNLYDGKGNVVSISGTAGNLIDADISASASIELSKLANIEKTLSVGTLHLMTDFKWTEGVWISSADGKDGVSAAWASTEKIPLTGGDAITVEYFMNNQQFSFHAYAADDTWLGRVIDENPSAVGSIVTLYPPENTAYIRLTVAKGYAGKETVCAPTVQTTLENYDFVDTRTRKVGVLTARRANEARFNALDALLWNYTKWKGKTIVADGNSLVAANTWLADLCGILDANPVNMGKSGGAITRPDQPSASAAIEEKRQYIIDNVANNYPDKADLILLQESSYLDGEYSDQMDGADPKTTWTARMNYMIRCLKTKYPNVLIALMPDPTWYRPGTSGTGNDSTSTTGLGDQVFNDRNRASFEKMRGLAEYNRLAFFDVDHSTPFNPLQLSNYYSQKYHLGEGHNQDGVHPYKPYSTAKGLAMAHFVAGLIFDPDAPNDAVEGWQGNIYVLNADGSANYPGLSVTG